MLPRGSGFLRNILLDQVINCCAVVILNHSKGWGADQREVTSTAFGSANREDSPVPHHAMRRSGDGALAASAAFSRISSRFSVSELSTHWRMTARMLACLDASADVIFPLAALR